MSSSAKTDKYELNMWQMSDIPEREDFVRDNVLIENAVSTHTENANIHITSAERSKWNSPFKVISYFGNGSASRSITFEAGFVPSWGIVFAADRPTTITDFDNSSDYNYFGFVSKFGSTSGLEISGNVLNVSQPATPVFSNEYRNFNENAVTYVVILFS